MKRFNILLAALMCAVVSVSAAIEKHVNWQASVEPGDNGTATLIVKATIDEGWHIYGLEMPQAGEGVTLPDPTTITIDPVEGLEIVGALSCTAEAATHFDQTMGVELPWLSGTFELRQAIKLNGIEGAPIVGSVRYMACSDNSCTPPDRYDFSLTLGTVDAVAVAAAQAATATATTSFSNDNRSEQWWQPVEVQESTATQSYWYIILFGFFGGLVALMTPCIWPMIPMTVSFFLKRSKTRRRAIADAFTYAASILVIFITLGFVLTLAFGPGKLNEIATGAVFNLIFFAMLVFFAVSFFGAFEITLPSKWTTATDAKANSAGGLLSIFFMAFTLVLVSFSCTGPIIGTLLVEAFSQSNILGPLLGMGSFALGLALPFGLFAFFPSLLKELPRSGSWLNTVKVVLGFIELILSLKFLSVADLAYGWHILDREVFLALWIVLFTLLGIYLLGKLRFPHDAPQESTSVSRFFLALISLSFAVYLVPGLWGAPLKAISAFAPPLYTQDFNLYGGEIQKYDDYDAGMAAAAAQGKPVLIDFSGYGCVNCRQMEGAVFDTPNVRSIIEDDYVMIVLMVDDKTELAEPITVEEEGRTLRLTTVGEKWSYLQRHKFATNQQPFYVQLDNEGKPLNVPRAHDENVDAFVNWLEQGVENYKN